MRLSSVYFAQLVPIPGTDRRETQMHASDGWTLERLDDGRIQCVKDLAVDGGTKRVDFVVERWPCVYEGETVPVTVTVDHEAREVTFEAKEPLGPAGGVISKAQASKRGKAK
jgi:hypothetical protein